MLDLVLPRRCAVCATPGAALCGGCATALPPAPPLSPPPPLEACWALLAYRDATPLLVAELKYRRHRDVVGAVGPALGRLLAGLVHASDEDDRAWTVTWAPTSAARRRERGFDQARLLARAAAAAAGVPARRTLVRTPGPAQTGRDRAHRLRGPAFRAVGAPIAGPVVVVDDVWTTGATLAAAGRALRAAGATRVRGLVLAARP